MQRYNPKMPLRPIILDDLHHIMPPSEVKGKRSRLKGYLDSRGGPEFSVKILSLIGIESLNPEKIVDETTGVEQYRVYASVEKFLAQLGSYPNGEFVPVSEGVYFSGPISIEERDETGSEVEYFLKAWGSIKSIRTEVQNFQGQGGLLKLVFEGCKTPQDKISITRALIEGYNSV